MDVTRKYAIAYKGLKDGHHDFSFEVDGALFEAYYNEEVKDANCLVEVSLERSESMLTLDVRIEGEVIVECDRCLEDCAMPIQYEGRLLVKFSDELRDYDGEIMWLSPAENAVELAQYIYESIILALPYQRIHPEGECDEQMLEHFRIISAEELAAIETQSLSDKDQQIMAEWAKLAEFKALLEKTEESTEESTEELK